MTMEVGCPQCGAKYQFDASAIPARGYDAQCTACGGVFFVAPEGPPDGQVTVSCLHCAAVYQFPASAIPAEGYEAQCTQCQQVFFVSATPPAAGTQPSSARTEPQPEAPTTRSEAEASSPQPEALTTEAGVPPVQAAAVLAPQAEVPTAQVEMPTAQAVSTTQSEAASSPQPEATQAPAVAQPEALPAQPGPPGALAGAPAKMPEEPTPLTNLKQPAAGDPVGLQTPEVETSADGHDMLAMANELGEPDASPDGVSLEDDFGTIITRRRRRRAAVLVAVGAVTAYSLVTYAFAPRAFDLTVGRVLPIKLTVDPDAIPHARRGLERMLDDTDAAYREALAELDKALAIDDRYPDAIAYKGLALVFRGSDIQARGRRIRAAGQRAIDEIRALEALPGNRRPKNSNQRLAELRARATEADRDAATLFEEGGKVVREGYALLRDALEAYEDNPLVVEAAGIYYTTDSDSVARAGRLLRHSVQLRYGADSELDLEAPPNTWLPYLHGLVRSADKRNQADVRAAFVAAYTKEPRFQRARYQLGLFEAEQDANREAERLAREILAQVGDHAKAKELLARIAPDDTGAPAAPAKTKKRKRKRR